MIVQVFLARVPAITRPTGKMLGGAIFLRGHLSENTVLTSAQSIEEWIAGPGRVRRR